MRKKSRDEKEVACRSECFLSVVSMEQHYDMVHKYLRVKGGWFMVVRLTTQGLYLVS